MHGGGTGAEDRGPSRGRGRVVAAGATVVLGLALLAACGGSSEGSSAGAAGANGVSATRGRQVYLDKCAQCHGADLQGTDHGPSHLSEVYNPNHHSDESFRRAVRQGSPQHHWCFGAMPPVEGVSDADLESVIAYVRQEQRQRGLVPLPPAGDRSVACRG